MAGAQLIPLIVGAVIGTLLITQPLKAAEIRTGEMLTLERCLDIAYKYNPTIVSAVSTVRMNETRVGQAQSNYYPQVTWQTRYSRIGPYNEGVDTYNDYSTTMGLTQNIFDFKRTPLRVEIAKTNTQSATSDLNSVKNTVALTVKQAYYSLLQAQKNRSVAEETVRQFALHLEQAQGFFQAGTRPKMDVTKAEVDLSNARVNLIRADNAVRIARINLNTAMGIPDAPVYSISEELTIPAGLIPFEEALNEAYRNRPDFQSISLKQAAAMQSVELAYKNHFPTISGNANYGFGGTEFPLEKGWSVGASVNIPVFNGFLIKNQVDEAKYNFNVITAQLETLKNDIRQETEQAYSYLVEARERIAATEIAVKQAQENADQVIGRYNVGMGSPIEVTDAIVTLANAHTNYIAAMTDFKQAQASLDKAMGRR